MSSPPREARSPRFRRPSSSTPSPPAPSSAQLVSVQAAASPPAAPASPGVPDVAADADDNDGGGGDDIPLTMTASVMLSQLPRDATAALAEAGTFPADAKVMVRFRAVGGSAPPLQRELCKINASQRFEAVVVYLRRILRVAPSDSVFLYVNSTFAPALDEIVGNLHRCFKDSNGQLNVSYSMTPAFG